MLLTDLFLNHIENLYNLNRETSTIEDHISKLQRFVKWFNDYKVKDITANDMEIYKADLIKSYASGTVNAHIEKINAMLNSYLLSILKLHLDDKEYNVLRMSYGLDCVKHSATEIANAIGINGTSSYVRVSQLKKQAIQKLIDNVDASQVIDFL